MPLRMINLINRFQIWKCSGLTPSGINISEEHLKAGLFIKAKSLKKKKRNREFNHIKSCVEPGNEKLYVKWTSSLPPPRDYLVPTPL